MEIACVAADDPATVRIGAQCNQYMSDLQSNCMEMISLIQESPQATKFIRKVCTRGRNSLNMIQGFQLMLAEESASNAEFRMFC